MLRILFGSLILAIMLAAQSAAPLRFDAKSGAASVKATIQGNQTQEYAFTGKKGQAITLSLKSPRASWLVLRVFPASEREGSDLFSNYISSDTELKGVLPADGAYRVFVGIRRPEARRGGGAIYNLNVSLKDRP